MKHRKHRHHLACAAETKEREAGKKPPIPAPPITLIPPPPPPTEPPPPPPPGMLFERKVAGPTDPREKKLATFPDEGLMELAKIHKIYEDGMDRPALIAALLRTNIV